MLLNYLFIINFKIIIMNSTHLIHLSLEILFYLFSLFYFLSLIGIAVTIFKGNGGNFEFRNIVTTYLFFLILILALDYFYMTTSLNCKCNTHFYTPIINFINN